MSPKHVPAEQRYQCNQCQSEIDRHGPQRPELLMCDLCQQQNIDSLASDTTNFSLENTVEIPKHVFRKKKRSTHSEEELLFGLDHRFPKKKMTVRYFLTTSIVAVLMLVFPAIYLALITAVGYTIVQFVLSTELFSELNFALASLFYFSPILVSVGVLVLLLKPFWAAPNSRVKQRTLKPSEAPMLYQFVNRIACTVGSPLPCAIHITLEPNASAHIQGQIKGIFNPKLVLTIGLPLIANMNMNQLAGVVAHELGHFSQGGGMRLRLLISTIQNWLTRIIVERDAFDETLQNGFLHSSSALFRGCCGMMAFMIGCVRFVLRFLLFLSNVLSCLLSRAMEFDADSYEVRLVGPDVFEQSLLKMTKLSFCYQKEMSETLLKAKRTTETQYKFPADFTRLVCQKSDRLSPDLQAVISDSVYNSRTGWFDPHPADADRLEAVFHLNEPGLYRCKYPARHLLPSLDQLSEKLTDRTFRNVSAWLY